MKRDARLIPFSREHHVALALARRIEQAADDSRRSELCRLAVEQFSRQLAPHFQLEETEILPVLQAQYQDQVARTLDEHRRLRQLAERIAGFDHAALAEFGVLLRAHTRFEDRELFPLFEALTAMVPAATHGPSVPARNTFDSTSGGSSL